VENDKTIVKDIVWRPITELCASDENKNVLVWGKKIKEGKFVPCWQATYLMSDLKFMTSDMVVEYFAEVPEPK
jgi:hypothetical protein